MHPELKRWVNRANATVLDSVMQAVGIYCTANRLTLLAKPEMPSRNCLGNGVLRGGTSRIPIY